MFKDAAVYVSKAAHAQRRFAEILEMCHFNHPLHKSSWSFASSRIPQLDLVTLIPQQTLTPAFWTKDSESCLVLGRTLQFACHAVSSSPSHRQWRPFGILPEEQQFGREPCQAEIVKVSFYLIFHCQVFAVKFLPCCRVRLQWLIWVSRTASSCPLSPAHHPFELIRCTQSWIRSSSWQAFFGTVTDLWERWAILTSFTLTCFQILINKYFKRPLTIKCLRQVLFDSIILFTSRTFVTLRCLESRPQTTVETWFSQIEVCVKAKTGQKRELSARGIWQRTKQRLTDILER